MSGERLASYTTLRLGGPAGRIVEARDEATLAATISQLDAASRPLLLLGGGSNVVITEDGFPGTVVLVRSEQLELDGSTLTVAAGTPWDRVVAFAVDHDLAGIECLSGIPGSTGATPIQNVGAYGQDVSQTIVSVKVLDRHRGEIAEMSCDDCHFAYRDSLFKHQPGRFAVLSVTFGLEAAPLSRPVAYRELAEKLDIPIGGRAPLADVRAAVIELRSGKGMVLDDDDPDTRSVGSFFTNPVVAASALESFEETPPSWPEKDGRVKLSAAWLVQHAGFERGFGNERARISTKHTLALTSGETGTTDDLLALARDIRAGVAHSFGIELTPEPVLIGVHL